MTKEIPTDKLPTKEEALQGLDNPMIKVLDDHNIDANRLATILDEGLEATVERPFNDKGDIIYSKPLIDHHTRQEARKDAHKLRGDYPAEKREVSGKLTLEEVIKGLESEED